MKGKIPESIINRSKQAYRAPIYSSFLNDNSPAYVKEMLSEKSVQDYGYFDSLKVNKLLDKLKTGKNVSEIDNMALAGIISTQLIHHLFIEKPLKSKDYTELSNLRIIRDN